MIYKSSIALFFLVGSALFISVPAWAKLVIHSRAEVEIELIIYHGLEDSSLFTGTVTAETPREIDTSYSGLALLVFPGGQRYPVILGDLPLTLQITAPDIPPSFPAGSENEFFYKLLSGEASGAGNHAFAELMIQAKRLLESSHAIHTTAELAARKKEFHEFIGENYDRLQHSDMLRRLIAQYFMMYEYVDYHRDGGPVTDIRARYEQAVLDGVENWIGILGNHLPDHEILNYCVSLYYDRSMVTLASLIVQKQRKAAYCQGVEKQSFNIPKDLRVTEAGRGGNWRLDSVNSRKKIAFVSTDCPVSMVETVVEARRLAVEENDVTLIVAPLQQLSDTHLAMRRMVSGGNLLFVDDESWSQKNLATTIKLPLFQEIEAE